jgi:hypothetical protein
MEGLFERLEPLRSGLFMDHPVRDEDAPAIILVFLDLEGQALADIFRGIVGAFFAHLGIGTEGAELADLDFVAALDFLLDQAFHRNLLMIGLFQHFGAGRGPVYLGGETHLPVFGIEEEDPELVSHLDGEIPVLVGHLVPVEDSLALPVELQEYAVLGNRHDLGLHRLAALEESHSGKTLFVHLLEIVGIRV